jgi:hypothetical protein
MLQRRFRTTERRRNNFRQSGGDRATVSPSGTVSMIHLSAVQQGKHASVTIRPPILTPAQKVSHI